MTEILVLRLSSLGDVVLTSSFLQSLADHFPDARVTFVVREDLAEVAAALPGVVRVVGVPRRMRAGGLLALARELGRGAYAHAFDVHGSLRARLLSLHLGAQLRPGFGKQALPRWVLVHLHRDVYARWGGARPLRERMLDPLRRLGLRPRLHATALRLPEPARARAQAQLAVAGEAYVALAPGARWPSKRWPAARWSALARALAADGRRVVLVGSAAERDRCAAVAAATGTSGVTDVAGKLDLLSTAAALERACLLVANDSGLLHVAEAVGRPVVALFGPTSPRFGYAPYRPASRLLYRPPPCSPCSKNGSRACSQPTHVCMEALQVEDVLAAVRAVVEGAPAAARRAT